MSNSLRFGWRECLGSANGTSSNYACGNRNGSVLISMQTGSIVNLSVIGRIKWHAMHVLKLPMGMYVRSSGATD